MARKHKVYELPPEEVWRPRAAYNFQGLRSHVDLSMPNGQKQCFGPASWYVPVTEEEEALLEHEYQQQNPPHFVAKKCPVEWSEELGYWVPVKPDKTTTED